MILGFGPLQTQGDNIIPGVVAIFPSVVIVPGEAPDFVLIPVDHEPVFRVRAHEVALIPEDHSDD